MLGELGGGGGFAGTLQARHQNHRWRLGREVDVTHALTNGGRELAVDDADQHLPRLQGALHLGAQSLFFYPGNEVPHHRQGHISLQQRHTHFAQHVRHIGFGDAPLAPEVFDEAGEFVGKSGGHRK